MIIPKTFNLMGREFKIVNKPKLDEDYHGLCMPDKNEIHIATDLPQTKLEVVYLHELVHAILALIGRHKLYSDEAFVDSFSGLLHQAITTQKGSIK